MENTQCTKRCLVFLPVSLWKSDALAGLQPTAKTHVHSSIATTLWSLREIQRQHQVHKDDAGSPPKESARKGDAGGRMERRKGNVGKDDAGGRVVRSQIPPKQTKGDAGR